MVDPGQRTGQQPFWLQQGGSSQWNSGKAYQGGAEVNYMGRRYRAGWWTQGDKSGLFFRLGGYRPLERLLI